jgi:hypothetical protein
MFFESGLPGLFDEQGRVISFRAISRKRDQKKGGRAIWTHPS